MAVVANRERSASLPLTYDGSPHWIPHDWAGFEEQVNTMGLTPPVDKTATLRRPISHSILRPIPHINNSKLPPSPRDYTFLVPALPRKRRKTSQASESTMHFPVQPDETQNPFPVDGGSPGFVRGTYSSDPAPPGAAASDILKSPITYSQEKFQPSPTSSVRNPRLARIHRLPHTLWQHLLCEISTKDVQEDEHEKYFEQADDNSKWQRVANFLSIPLAVEQMMLFGILICLDSFLYTFTILPLRFLVAIFGNISKPLIVTKTSMRAIASKRADIIRGSLFIVSCIALCRITDPSRMYHSVRGQDTIKLYVIFNAFEQCHAQIGDKLCCAFGQDILDSLFARTTLLPNLRILSQRLDKSQPSFWGSIMKEGHSVLKFAIFYSLSFAYIIAHTMVFLYQLVALNVAINSYDNALMTLLLSNQFVEIKGSVFKRFEKENLFQITCADIVERFQLGLMLFVIGFRNTIEMGGSDAGFLPSSLTSSTGKLQTLISPLVIVMVSEMIVDWLKHAFITKFNHIRPTIYNRFADVLSTDFVSPERFQLGDTEDQSATVSRRLGFAALPLGCLVVRIGAQILEMLADSTSYDECSPTPTSSLFGMHRGALAGGGWQLIGWVTIGSMGWALLVGLKVGTGLNLLAYSLKQQVNLARNEEEDEANNFGRSAIAEGKKENLYNQRIHLLLDKEQDNISAPGTPADNNTPMRNKTSSAKSSSKPSKRSVPLEDVQRYSMLKRIW